MKSFILSLFIILVLTGCDKLVDLGEDSNDLSSGDVFSNDQSASAVAIHIYRDMMEAVDYANGNITRHPGLYSDELQKPGGTPTEPDLPWFNSHVLPSDKNLLKLWGKPYDYIYQCNNILENIADNQRLSDTLKVRLEGESKFLRAFHYFHLVNLFGEVPEVTGTDYRQNLGKARSSQEQIWQLITNDLLDAARLLPDNQNTTDRTLQTGIRATRWAAKAMLSRAYLYQKNWEKAIQYASEVINENRYQLEADLNNVFLVKSREIMFQLQPVKTGNNSAEATFFLPAQTSSPLLVIREGLYKSFEPNDQRRKNWLGSYVTGGKTYYYPNKYKTRSATPAKEYNVALRYAELFLIRAEARAHLGNLYGAGSAAEDLNRIRTRAGLTAITGGLTQKQILQSIGNERSIEFFAEWGHRWFDLKRMAAFNNPAETRAEEVLRVLKLDFSKYQLLLPVPESERTVNANLDQNPGYY